MPPKIKNGDILSFFRPVPAENPRPSQTSAAAAGSPLPPPPSSSPPRAGQGGTPAEPPRQDLEIGASDEEDEGSDGGSSDDSLEDLSTLLGRSRPGNVAPGPAPARPRQDPYATPRAKRTAVEFHASPLAFMPKHKFDMKALAKDARQDDATNLSSLRVKAAEESREDEASRETDAAPGEALVGVVRGNGGQDAQKVLRAVQRAEPGQAQLRYCFFEQDYKVPPSSSIPQKAVTGPWRLLTKGNAKAREQNLISGLPYTILLKTGGLPDELFLWILDELCIQKSFPVRQEYYNLISACPEQVGRLVTPQRLEELFIRLGARGELRDRESESAVLRHADDPYQGRDWACLQSFLILLGLVAHLMPLASITYVAQALLLMSMDRALICSIDTLTEFEHTMQQLLGFIPQSSWASFCFETCRLLETKIKVQCIRTNALLCLPVSNKRAHDLRRRLAISFLFGDPALGRHHADEIITIRGATDRLATDDFAVGPKTDFAELRASIMLLDMAIDDGSFAATGDPDDEKRFNEEIDELALKLREIWRKINDSGMKLARTEAKSVIEWVQQRMSHSVRTRRKARKSVFDIPGQREDPFLPRQQDLMSNFLKKQPETAN